MHTYPGHPSTGIKPRPLHPHFCHFLSPSTRPQPLRPYLPLPDIADPMYRAQRATRLSTSVWQRAAAKEQYERDETDYSDESEREYDEKAYDELYRPEFLSYKVRWRPRRPRLFLLSWHTRAHAARCASQ